MDTGINPNSVLKLNVGGKEFMTTQGTLSSDQNSMLARMFSTDANGRIPATQDVNGAFFIDRCPKYFGVILNFLRSGKLEKVANVDLKFLRNEAEYFCIQGLIKLIDEDIENFTKEESSKNEKLERIDTNITKIVPIMTSCMMMTKQGAAEDYFNNILKSFYSESERKYCMEQVESWFTDLTQNSDMAKELGFMELLDTLLSDDAYRQRAQNNEKFKKLLRIALNLVYLRKWKTSPDFEVFALNW